MFRCVTKITFNQQPSPAYPDRDNAVIYDFCHEFESEDSWADLTNKAKITLPKNVYVRDENNKLIPLGGTNITIGGFGDNIPLFLRGDVVKIEAGYRFLDSQRNDKLQTSVIFQGYISNVASKKPIVLECEDNMWKLKQIIAPNKVYPAKTYTLEKILGELLQGSGFTVRHGSSQTNFGDFRTQNETVCEVLARIRKDFHFESYFRGSELRCGYPIYVEQDAIDDGKKIFKFQQNIISDSLDYRRKDDINLSAIAYSINKLTLPGTTKDGKKKTRQQRLEVLVNVRNGNFVSSQRAPGTKADFAPNTAGERRTLYFWNVTNAADLITLATNELKKYYYTGFRGKFTTFGIPYVRQGDNLDVLDNVLPERNGRYKVKSVKYTGGVNGMRQEVELDFLITLLDAVGKPA